MMSRAALLLSPVFGKISLTVPAPAGGAAVYVLQTKVTVGSSQKLFPTFTLPVAVGIVWGGFLSPCDTPMPQYHGPYPALDSEIVDRGPWRFRVVLQ